MHCTCSSRSRSSELLAPTCSLCCSIPRFDLAAAVLYPIAVLSYCYYNFSFDRAVYLVNAEVLPDGNFERYARMQADPAQVALFLLNFNSLRISGVLDFILSIGLNLSFCYRFVRVISVIITQRYRDRGVRRKSFQGSASSVLKPVQRQRSVPHSVALVFLTASVCVVASTCTAVTKSQAACATYSRVRGVCSRLEHWRSMPLHRHDRRRSRPADSSRMGLSRRCHG